MTWYDVPRRVEEWQIPGKQQVSECATDCKHARHQTVLAMFLGFRKPLYSCTEGMCYSSTRPCTSYHVTQFTRPSPALVLQATNTGARRPEYEATFIPGYLLKVYIMRRDGHGDKMQVAHQTGPHLLVVFHTTTPGRRNTDTVETV